MPFSIKETLKNTSLSPLSLTDLRSRSLSLTDLQSPVLSGELFFPPPLSHDHSLFPLTLSGELFLPSAALPRSLSLPLLKRDLSLFPLHLSLSSLHQSQILVRHRSSLFRRPLSEKPRRCR